MQRHFALAGVLIAGALATAGCGSSENSPDSKTAQRAPSPSTLLAEAMTASEKQDSAAFVLDAKLAAQSDDPQVDQFFAKPVAVKLTGAASPEAADLSGVVSLNDQRIKFGVRANAKQSFVSLMDKWYGPGSGLSDNATGAKNSKADLDKAREAVLQYGNDVLTGKVTEGPERDGQPTWQFDGALNADGIIKVA